MNEIIAIVGASAGKELFKKLVTGVYAFVSRQTDRKIRQWNTERKIETLYRKISLVRRVKTIWQVDKPVDLSAFYCDSHVVVDEKRKCIRQLADFTVDGNILIEGIAGQGKSIFLRYLCAVELAQGQRIPLFIELRRIDRKHSLSDRIYAAFEALGLAIDDDIFEALAASGKILLLLDAFDEVPEVLKPEILTDIEDLASSREGLRIVLSSRPNQSVRASSYFDVVTLDNLQGDEYAQVVSRLAKGQKWADSLIEHIEERASHIKELLCTPLMVTLLVLLYKSYQHLPAKLSEFYDALFQTLLQRHDGTKPGFTRHRSCELDDTQYRSVFEAACIVAKKSAQQTYTAKDLYDITKKALSLCDLQANPAAYVNDIVRITCLILREGEEHRFIHKTVQEYYTAAFVLSKPEPWAKQFYSRILKKDPYGEWRQELDFLSEIDLYRYRKYFLLPAHLSALEITEKHLSQRRPSTTPNRAKALLNDLFFNIEAEQRGLEWVNLRTDFLNRPVITAVIHALHRENLMEAMSKKPIEVSAAATRRLVQTQKIPARIFKRWKNIVPATALLDDARFRQSIMSAIDAHQKKLFKQARQISDSLEEVESVSLLEGLV